MSARRRTNRVLQRVAGCAKAPHSVQHDAPRVVGRVVVDFTSLTLPVDIRRALAEAFWSHFDARSPTILGAWANVRVFGRFAAETRAVQGLSSLSGGLLARYIEWLNSQCDVRGTPWRKATRASRYTTLRTLLRWLERCRPDLIAPIDYPFNPFPWRTRSHLRRRALGAGELRAILKACEREISELRELREHGRQLMAAARAEDDPDTSLGALLNMIDQRFGGIATARVLVREHHFRIDQYGHLKGIEPYLYPSRDGILPYYLAILVHTAGNPAAIATLQCDCLQPIPLLEDREMLVWAKPRAGSVQRRSFRSTGAFEPPALVREVLEWTRRLRSHVRPSQRNRLFLAKSIYGVRAMTQVHLQAPFERFLARHGLPAFTLCCIRPSVLTAFYQGSGDLRQVKAIANHAHLSTTIGYIEGPQVQAQNRVRIAALQTAFLGHLGQTEADRVGHEVPDSHSCAGDPQSDTPPPPGTLVSMFGFGCKDPYAGIAPGTHRGELCTNFLGCLTCPNAIIADDARTLARLLQARDHLRVAAAHVHPARWQALYEPQLRILEEDLLPRFAAQERVAAELLKPTLPPLPPLR